MAGWGTGSFENDDARDWIGKLDRVAPAELTRIFSDAADGTTYIEAPEASVVVAAAEVVALSESSASGVPAAILNWTTENRQAFTADLKATAVRALERVRRNSELKDLWLEADGLNDWIAAIQDLQTRLTG